MSDFLLKVKRFIKSKLFVYGIGSLPKQYDSLDSPVERMQWAFDNFGKSGLEVIEERDINKWLKLREAFGSLWDM